jgi:hypothetical protein
MTLPDVKLDLVHLNTHTHTSHSGHSCSSACQTCSIATAASAANELLLTIKTCSCNTHACKPACCWYSRHYSRPKTYLVSLSVDLLPAVEALGVEVRLHLTAGREAWGGGGGGGAGAAAVVARMRGSAVVTT